MLDYRVDYLRLIYYIMLIFDFYWSIPEGDIKDRAHSIKFEKKISIVMSLLE